MEMLSQTRVHAHRHSDMADRGSGTRPHVLTQPAAVGTGPKELGFLLASCLRAACPVSSHYFTQSGVPPSPRHNRLKSGALLAAPRLPPHSRSSLLLSSHSGSWGCCPRSRVSAGLAHRPRPAATVSGTLRVGQPCSAPKTTTRRSLRRRCQEARSGPALVTGGTSSLSSR